MIAALLLALLGEAAPPSKTAAPAASTAAPAPDVRTFVGQIIAVDASKGTMTVGESVQASRPKTAKLRETVTLAIDASTQVFRGKRAAAKEELHAHDHVVVRYVMAPQGPRALSCRISDTVARRPPPTAAATASVGGAPAPN